MSRNKSRKFGQCVYCGAVGPIEYDHIPPKNLFVKPRPNNLIKVPSCAQCHSENPQVSQDDEYFRLMITLREDIANHPDVEQLLPIVLRSLKRSDKVGFSRSLLKKFNTVDVRSQSGLYLGKKLTYDVNLARLDNVAKRIAKGLFYHETGNRLPDGYEVAAYSESGLRNITDDVKQDLRTRIIQPLMENPPHIMGNKVFSYRVAYSDKDINSSAWLLTFYERIAFLCLIAPKISIS
jgi:hypothetical protein